MLEDAGRGEGRGTGRGAFFAGTPGRVCATPPRVHTSRLRARPILSRGHRLVAKSGGIRALRGFVLT